MTPLKPGDTLPVVDEQGLDIGLVAIWNPKPVKRPKHLRLIK
jgi:hypothetical protein